MRDVCLFSTLALVLAVAACGGSGTPDGSAVESDRGAVESERTVPPALEVEASVAVPEPARSAAGYAASSGAGAAASSGASSGAASAASSGAASAASSGTARVSLTSDGLSVSGDFSTTACGGPYIMGEGFAFQTQADDWQITIASENREAGSVPLNTADGSVNVVVTANGPGQQFVRGPRNRGTLTISDDFRRAEADLELRQIVGRETARLVATFTCDAPAG